MDKDFVKLNYELLERILTQLYHSDSMEVTDERLIQQKIYYIDNVYVIEEVEKSIVKHFYENILADKGNVNYDDLFNLFTPQYINYDKYFNELEKANGFVDEEVEKESNDGTLNKYF